MEHVEVSDPEREVWLFFVPGAPSQALSQLRKEVRDVCTQARWRLQERRMLVDGPNIMISAEDAVNVYRRIHRAQVAVLVLQNRGDTGPVLPRRTPKAPHNVRAAWLSIRHFVMHKAFFRRLRPNRGARRWPGSFNHWCSRIDCAGQGDPRCLPLHVFELDRDRWRRRLYDRDGRQAFDRHHTDGHGQRRDGAGFAWGTGPMHGRERLIVAGCTLTEGFHWDVLNQGEPKHIHTPIETWKVREYVNVSPDASVRGREPYAKKMPTQKPQ